MGRVWGGGKESSSFGVIEYGTPQRGRVWEGGIKVQSSKKVPTVGGGYPLPPWEGDTPSHGGEILELWVVTKNQVWGAL